MAKTGKAIPKRTYLKQRDVPSASLEEAIRIPAAIFDHYGGKPAAPIQVAKALNMAPNGSQIQVLSGAAIAFGLIEGGAQASLIGVTTPGQTNSTSQGGRGRTSGKARGNSPAEGVRRVPEAIRWEPGAPR